MIRFTEPCPQCEGTGGQMHQHIVGVAGHAPGCEGVTCERACPVEVPIPVEEFEPCPSCVGGTVPDDATVEAAAATDGKHHLSRNLARHALIAAARHQRAAGSTREPLSKGWSVSDSPAEVIAKHEARIRDTVDKRLALVADAVDHGPLCDACVGVVARVAIDVALAALREAGWELYRPEEYATTSRYRTHHVELRRTAFVVEHPVDCDLARCGLFERLQDQWKEPPGPLGWYEVDEHGAISRAQDRTTYRLIPVESPGG